jgi:hypothetical protein
MSEPHRHHFIPAFYLRQWHGPDEKLVEYTIKHRKLIPKPVSADATGFQRDLYEFPELPSPLSQFLGKEFFNYADRTAADALNMLLDGLPKHLWSSEMLSAWARFIIGVHTRHFDTIPEICDAAKSLWAASGTQSQWIYETAGSRETRTLSMDCPPRSPDPAQGGTRPDGRRNGQPRGWPAHAKLSGGDFSTQSADSGHCRFDRTTARWRNLGYSPEP